MTTGNTTKTATPIISTTQPPKTPLPGATSSNAVKPPTEEQVVQAVTEVLTGVKKEHFKSAEIDNNDLLTEADLADVNLEARPLSMPSTLNVKAKDPHYAYRWVNKDGDSGNQYRRMLARGFVNASTKDLVEWDETVSTQDDKVIIGDLILMKIQRERLKAALKYNHERSQNAVSGAGASAAAKNAANKQLQEDRVNVGNKVQFYTPGEKDMKNIEKTIGPDITSQPL